MRMPRFTQLMSCLALGIGLAIPATAEKPTGYTDVPDAATPSRVVERVDDARRVQLKGDVHPAARPQLDKGQLDSNKRLERMILVLKRSPEQEAALAAFNERQYEPTSSDFHRWLSATEFGKLYGPSDSDMTQITSWLQNHGFTIDQVSKGRVTIQFSGTVAQVQDTFHVEMHNYLVNGKMHIANDRAPSIPEALFPVVTGVASLNDFFPTRTRHPKLYIKRDLKTGKYSRWKPEHEVADEIVPRDSSPNDQRYYTAAYPKGGESVEPNPNFVFSNPDSTNFPNQVLAPYDVATIYNILPLWKESTPIDGTGISVAIVGYSDVETSDFNTFRSSFGLPAGTLTTLHDGDDPGVQTDGSQGENTLDVEMVSSTAPGAHVILVSNVSTATTDGLAIGINYIVENNIAPILTMSYLKCELELGTSGNSYWSGLFQQAATQGITPLTCSDDAGSAGCTSQDGTSPYGDQYGLAVSGMTSTPYVTSVGGSDLQWYLSDKPESTYWNSTNNATTGASAKGYMPEMAWNTSCTNPLLVNNPLMASLVPDSSSSEAICNGAINSDPALVSMGSGGGGVSSCTTNSSTSSSTSYDPSSCSGGYATPSWQKGVPGTPTDGKRHVPDMVMFGSYGYSTNSGLPLSALLICQADETQTGTCDYTNGSYIVYEANGGTSAATPLTAGVMALVLQKTGSKQGLANPMLYSLASKENYSSCNSNTVAAGNSCIFYDITTGSNAMNCYTGGPDCVTHTSGDEAGILSGYSATTGYDMTTGLGSLNVTNLVNAWSAAVTTAPAITLSPTTLTFPSTTIGATSAAQVVTVKNTGTAAATLTSETFTGTNATAFIKSATTCGSTLAAAASCTISIEFKAPSAGAKTATLDVADNATGSPQTVALTGTGAAASTSTLTLSPTSIAFPATVVGATSDALAVTVKNAGTAAVTISSIAIGGANATSFLQVNECGASLAAGASCSIYVAFKPASAAALSGTLSVTDTASGSPQTVSLTGTGTAAPSVKLSVTSIAFPSTAVGATSAPQAVTLTNSGTAILNLTSITLTGTNPGDFEQLNTCGATLAAGANCVVYVGFKPAAAAAYKATLSIADNGASSPQSVALTGTGK